MVRGARTLQGPTLQWALPSVDECPAPATLLCPCHIQTWKLQRLQLHPPPYLTPYDASTAIYHGWNDRTMGCLHARAHIRTRARTHAPLPRSPSWPPGPRSWWSWGLCAHDCGEGGRGWMPHQRQHACARTSPRLLHPNPRISTPTSARHHPITTTPLTHPWASSRTPSACWRGPWLSAPCSNRCPRYRCCCCSKAVSVAPSS